MSTDTFIVKLPNKQIVSTIRTDSGRLFKISTRRIKTDGPVPEAVEVPPSYVGELVARFGIKNTVIGKARIRRFREEEAV